MSLQAFWQKGKWLLLIPLIDSIYLLLNHGHDQMVTLVTIFDQRLPFIQYFVIPYVAWYALIFVALIWFMYRDSQLYMFSLASIILGLLLSFIIFSIFQTTVPRPEHLGEDVFSQLTQFVYTIDNPYNAFPSIHVLTSYIVFLGCLQTKDQAPKISYILQGTAILVILSTLFLKQHTLLDVLGGMILGGSLFKTVHRLNFGLYNKGQKPVSEELAINAKENEPLLELIGKG